VRGLHHIEVGAVEADSAQNVRERIHAATEIPCDWEMRNSTPAADRLRKTMLEKVPTARMGNL
jgi:hypothetical protein